MPVIFQLATMVQNGNVYMAKAAIQCKQVTYRGNGISFGLK